MAKSIRVNMLASVSLKILNILFPLITGPYIARVLSKESYAIFNVSHALIALFLPFAGFGIYNYGIRLISKYKHNLEEIKKKFTSLFIISIGSSLFVWLIYMAYILINHRHNYFSLYMVMGLQILSQFIYIEWMNEAFESYGFILIKTLIIRILMLIGVFTLIKNADDYLIYGALTTGIIFMNYFISFIYLKTKVAFTKVTLSEIVVNIKPLLIMLLLTNANLLYILLDRNFLAFSGKAIEVSYYTFANTISQLITNVVFSIVLVSIPRLSFFKGKNDHKNYANTLYQTSSLFFFFIIPMGIGLALLSSEAIYLYAGFKYLPAAILLFYFSLRICVWSINQSLANQVFFINGKEIITTIIFLIGGTINIILNLVLVIFDLSNAKYFILTTIFAELVVMIIQFIYLKKHNLISLRKYLTPYFKYFLVSLGFVLISLLIKNNLSNQYTIKAVINRSFWIILLSSFYYAIAMIILKDPIACKFINYLKNLIAKR